jgi:hypothetical protein
VSDGDSSGAIVALLRALGTMLGLHIQYAQREVKADVGRVLTGVVLLVVALLFLTIGLVFGHIALVSQLVARTSLGPLGAPAVVALGDVVLATILLLAARSRLQKPVLEQTRSLVKRTVSSLAEVTETRA